MTNQSASQLQVEVRLENSRPDSNIPGCYWVSRDTRTGIWHSFCETKFASTAAEAIAAMYHACEVATVEADDHNAHRATATINR